MLDPATMSMITQFALPALAGIFGNKAKPRSPEEMLRALHQLYGQQLGPAVRGMIRSGVQTGANVEQNFRAAAGRSGALRTGTGSVATGLAMSAASNRAADAEFQGAQAVSTLATQAFPTAMAGDLAGVPFQSSRFQDVLGNLGQMQGVTGFDPMKAMVNAGVRLFGTQRAAPTLQQSSVARQNQSASFGSLQGSQGASARFGR